MTEVIEDLEAKGPEDIASDDGSILRRARDCYGVKLEGVEVISKESVIG